MALRCVICRDRESAALENSQLGLYRCRSCGHVFKLLPEEKRQNYGEDYYLREHKNWFNNPDYRLFEHINTRIIKARGAGPLKVLDIGCGRGDFLKYLMKRNPGLELHGLDLSPNAHPGINFIKGDVLDLDTDDKFDIITNIAVIEHVDSPLAYLDKIKDILADDGLLFTVTDNDDGMIYATARILKRAGINAPYDRLYKAHHLQCFTARSLKIAMEASGFAVIARKNHNHPVAAVDYPGSGPVQLAIFSIAVRVIFMLSSLLNRGILQMLVCRKKGR